MEFSAYYKELVKEYKLNTTFRSTKGESGIGFLNSFIRSSSEDYEKLRRSIAPELHEFIKENGIPTNWPIHISRTLLVDCPENLPDHIRGDVFTVPFHYMAELPKPIQYSTPSNHFFTNIVGETVLKSSVSDRAPYIPSADAIRDKEYGEMLSRAEKMKKEHDSLEWDIEKEKKKAEDSAGIDSFENLFIDLLVTGFLRMLVVAFVTLIIVSFLFVTAWNMIPGVASQSVAPIFLTVSSIVIGGFLAYRFVIKKLVSNQRTRRAYGDSIRSMEASRDSLEEERTKLLNSEKYHAAKERQEKLAKEDRELAIRWQNEWKEAILREKPSWLYTD